jgi:branched-chain amino acid aminotransferase
MGGALRPWDDARLHIGTEAITRGLNVFEGVVGLWQPDSTFAIVELRAHYARLKRSARLLHIPFETPYEDYQAALRRLIAELVEPGRDMWARTSLYVTEGHWGEGTVADLVVAAFHHNTDPPSPITLGVSTWRRSVDVSHPARIKTGSNYQVSRLARIEGRAQGADDMVLLNEWGRVAEATGSCILMVREGVVYTPPSTEGALESITVNLIEALAGSLRIPFVRRPIDRTELLIADEIALCGTLAGVVPVRSIEGAPLSEDAPMLRALQTRYLEAVKGIVPHPSVHLERLSLDERAKPGDDVQKVSAVSAR